VSLAQLHDILCERSILVLDVRFYADESGIHDEHGKEEGAEVAVIGGYIATKRQWKLFAKRWDTVLCAFNVPEFHMSQYYRKKQDSDSPYLGWPNTEKKRFLRQLIKVARDNTTAAYASMVQTKAWDTILDPGTKLGIPKRQKDRIVDGKPVLGELVEEPHYNPYIICFQNFFAKLPYFLKEMVDPVLSRYAPPEQVAFVFHRHKDFGPAAQVGYNIVHKDFDHEHRLGTISFGSTEKCPPLQAADLLAFYARKRFTRYLKNIAPDEFEMALLGNEKKVWLLELTPDNLKDLRQKNEQARYARDVASGKTTTGTR
jgi:hypothetical protein